MRRTQTLCDVTVPSYFKFEAVVFGVATDARPGENCRKDQDTLKRLCFHTNTYEIQGPSFSSASEQHYDVEAAKISGVDIDKIYGRVKEIVKTTCENIPDNQQLAHTRSTISPLTSENSFADEEPEKLDKDLALMISICEKRGRVRRQQMTETHHQMHHFYHFVDACEQTNGFFSDWGESTSKTSARRRNQDHNIQDRTRIGMRVDYRLVSQSSMEAELVLGETSGDLPRCACGKLCHLDQAALESLKVFSFQLVHFDLYVYVMGHRHGLWRMTMVDSCTLPATNADRANRLEVHQCLKTMFKTVETQMDIVLRLNARRCTLNKRRIPSPDFYAQKRRYGVVQSPTRAASSDDEND